MARSKAQQRVLHKSDCAMQMKRPLPGARPTAFTASSALFQLGRLAKVPSVAPVRSEVKNDVIPSSRQSGSSLGQAIDLTLDDEEEEDEPMGAQQTVASNALTATHAIMHSIAPDTCKSTNKSEEVAQSSLQLSDVMVSMVGDAESDVDEDWPIVSSPSSSVPGSVPMTVRKSAPTLAHQSVSALANSKTDHSQTQKDVNSVLDAVCKKVPVCQEKIGVYDHNQTEVTRQQTSTSLPNEISNGEIKVDGSFLHQARESLQNTADIPSSTNDVAQAELLEDGEIFEERVAPTTCMPTVMRDRVDVHNETIGSHPHQRNKKQKKRGKKKTKRKLDAIQMNRASLGELPPTFNRTTRQRVIAAVSPAGQYALALTRTYSRGTFGNVRPVYQDPSPVPFCNGGGLYPPIRPLPQRLHNPPLSQPYEESQILRVNRQGSMEMLSGEMDRPLHTFSEAMIPGAFKYRSKSVPSLRPKPDGPSHKFQHSVSDRPCALDPVPPREHHNDLNRLRAAALQSKINRSVMTKSVTLTTAAASEKEVSANTVSSSPTPRPTIEMEKILKSASTSSENELRLEILRSMKRNRKEAINKTQDDDKVLTPPATPSSICKKHTLEIQPANAATSVDSANNEIAILATQGDQATAEPSKEVVLKEKDGVISDSLVNTSVTIIDVDKNADTFTVKASSPAKLPADEAGKTPQFHPLTACSQSVVIRLCSEDYSPREGEDDARGDGNSLQDAINEMRRKIAKREQEQTNRLRLSSTAKSSSSSSSEAPSLPTSIQRLSPVKKVSAVLAPLSGDTASREVSSSAFEAEENQMTIAHADGAEVKKASGEFHVQTFGSEENLPTEVTSRSGPREVLGFRGHSDSVAVIKMATPMDTSQTEDVTSVSVQENSAIDASISNGGKSDINFDAVRAEYKQCVAKCVEANSHIVRLSNEVAQLEIFLLRANSIIGER